jgi:hypothetical protein
MNSTQTLQALVRCCAAVADGVGWSADDVQGTVVHFIATSATRYILSGTVLSFFIMDSTVLVL